MTKVIFPPSCDTFSDGSWGKGDCGHNIRVDWNFCPKCGSPVEEKVMIEDERPILIAICGKSCTGKSSLAKWLEKDLAARNKSVNRIISCTTRPARKGEVNGIDYMFVNPYQFYELAEDGQLLEYAEFRGWHYGTLRETIRPNDINIGIFNAKGIRSLAKFKEEFNIIPVYLDDTLKVRLQRSFIREHKWKLEYLRRAFVDWKDFRDIQYWLQQFPQKLIFKKENSVVKKSVKICDKICV